MKQTTEFSFNGELISYDEFEQIWKAVQSTGEGCTVSVHQTKYDEGPYGTSTTTYIEVEAN